MKKVLHIFILILCLISTTYANQKYSMEKNTRLKKSQSNLINKAETKKKEDVNKSSGGVHSPSNINTKEGAVIVFAIIGAVAIISWVPMMYLTISDIIEGKREFEIENQTGIEFSFLTANHSKIRFNGNYSAVHFSTLLKLNEEKSFGFSSLLGKFHFNAKEYEKDEVIDKSFRSANFLLFGPSVKFFIKEIENKKLYINFELLAGKSDRRDDFMSTARLKLHQVMTSNTKSFWNKYHWGLNLGATYYKIDHDEGIFNKASPFNYSMGLSLDRVF